MKFNEFIRSEDGSGGAWSLFIFIICAAVAGVAIDGTNAMRAKEHLQSTADIAAHAGVVELANGSSHEDIRERVVALVEANMPQGVFGNSLGVSSDTIVIGSFDGETVTDDGLGPENAVYVSLERSSLLDNAVPTFLLKLIGKESWDVVATGAAMVGDIADCNGNDGIYAVGQIKMTSISEIGTDFCIYSKDVVELSNHNVFHPGSRLGMPDLADCDKCTNSHNPGVEDAVFEGNLLFDDVEEHIDAVANSLLGNSSDMGPADDFLYAVALGSDMTPLDDLGYQVNKISKGSIISISAGDFEAMDFVPEGLVYAVYCSSALSANGALSPTGSASSSKGNSKKNSGSSNSNVKTLSMETGSGASISDVAIITDCQIKFGKTAEIVNSVIVTTSTSNQSVSAFSKARIGSGLLTCPSTEKVVIMTQGDMSIPAGLETNNVDFLVAGDVHLASGTSSQAVKLGTSFYVDGEMHISAQGNWFACGDEPDSFAGGLEAIRHVIATDS